MKNDLGEIFYENKILKLGNATRDELDKVLDKIAEEEKMKKKKIENILTE